MDEKTKAVIERFENDMVYDCHNYTSRYGRSQGRMWIMRRGQSVLPALVEHLKAHPPGKFMNLNTAWGNLLSDLTVGCEWGASIQFTDIPTWIEAIEQNLLHRPSV